MALTAFAGMYSAVEFAYGWPKSNAAALQVTQGSTGTGAYTIVCSPSSLQTSAGLTIPINTGTPILIGSDSGIETVTPSAVSTDNLGRVLITATFTYAHGTGAQVRSGDAGLNEALTYVGNAGGGVVVVDAGWTRSGGTSTMLASAVVPAGVTIDDNRGGAGLAVSTITLTNAQILALNTTPVQLLANADANSMYYVTQAVVVNLNTGVAYASGGAIEIGYGTTTVTTEALSGTIAATFLTTPIVPHVITLAGAQIADTTASTYAGKGIWINNATGNFTTGTGTLSVTLSYVKVPA